MDSPASAPKLARFAWITLAVNFVVILWGALVRATGSGAGCGSHWPLCDGVVVPRSPTNEMLIEYTHRLTSGVALVLVLILAVWCRRAFRRGHPARPAALWSLILILIEAALGAGLVLFELVAGNTSMMRAGYMAAHLVNTFFLVAALGLTAYFAGGAPRFTLRGQRRRVWRYGLAIFGTLLVGTSGAITALGDTLFPAASHAEGLSQSFSPGSPTLLQVRLVHPLLAVTVGFLLIELAAAVLRASPPPEVRRWARWLLGLVVAQLVAGIVNYGLLAPIGMQLFHLLLADLLWLALVLTAASDLAPARAR